MRESHLKMICSDKSQPRHEWILRTNTMLAMAEGFQVYSALYGDGKTRYTDVTKTVQEWATNGIWPENWEELLYAQRKPRAVGSGMENMVRVNGVAAGEATTMETRSEDTELRIDSARYGVLNAPVPFREHSIDVTERVRSLVKNNGLDIIVNNSTLTPNENPYRGKRKVLLLTYGYGDRERVTVEREEKDWLIIGPVRQREISNPDAGEFLGPYESGSSGRVPNLEPIKIHVKREELNPMISATVTTPEQMSAVALNDYLIRKFSISPQRLRGPMPIELRDFHRNDLAQLFAELGFKRGAEIGVAEGNYSEVLLKANPECELLLVDPWHHYSDNPQGKSKEKHEFAYNETLRKVQPYPHAQVCPDYSLNVAENIDDDYLDFAYVDGNHLFDYVIQDLIHWSNKVRSGGIVSGDDYYALDQKRWTGGGVVEAVQAYTNAHRIPVWFIFQGHKSTDFMWVKP